MARRGDYAAFRPWCPVCEATSKPSSRHCDRCGLGLYPTEAQLETLVALMRALEKHEKVEQ